MRLCISRILWLNNIHNASQANPALEQAAYETLSVFSFRRIKMPPNLAEMTEKQTREMNDLTWAAEDMTDSQSEQPEQTEPEEPEQDDNDNSADDE